MDFGSAADPMHLQCFQDVTTAYLSSTLTHICNIKLITQTAYLNSSNSCLYNSSTCERGSALYSQNL